MIHQLKAIAMKHVINGTYDGRDIRPDEPLPLPRNTRVTLTWDAGEPEQAPDPLAAAETELPRTKETFAEAVRRIRIDGPADWSERMDYYLGQQLRDAAG